MSDTKKGPEIQGEGDYRAARRYRRDLKDFLERSDPESLARDAAPRTEAEQRELLDAEREGRARAKGKGPGKQQADRR